MTRGYAAIGLDRPKCPANIGGVMRAAACYGASMIAVAGERGNRAAKCPTDTTKAWRGTPLLLVDDLYSVIPYDCVPVAVEIVEGALSLFAYRHPERAFYVFGAEDATLGDRVLSWCRDTIYVPTKYCMNLAATANVVLYDRAMKAQKGGAT